MMFDPKSFGKMPVAFQAIIGFVLMAYGVVLMVNNEIYASGDIRFSFAFLSIGVLYLVAGLPSFLEGVMIMYRQSKDETKTPSE